MTPRTRILLALAALALFSAVAAFALPRSPRFPREAPVIVHDASRHFDRDLFYAGITAPHASDADRDAHIRAAVVPHHYVGAPFIAEVFTLLARQRPATVILLGPNHDEAGASPVLTSAAAWDTPFGRVFPDDAARAALLAAVPAAAVDETVLPADHAVAGLLPFVARSLPDARVVPVLLKRHPDAATADALAAALAAAASDPRTVIIGSIDFSHYLTAAQADARDARTMEAFRAGDARAIAAFDNGHLDAPPVAIALLRAMAPGAFTVLGHENSGRMLREPLGSTTSYFTLVWYDEGI